MSATAPIYYPPYTVAHAMSIDELRERVCSAIGEGYVPLGGIGVMHSDTYAPFYQALHRPTKQHPCDRTPGVV